jgi:Flp pilus assembly protein CpaB
VLVAAVPIEAGKALTEQDVDSLFESRSLPHDVAPVDAISDRGELIGSRATGDVAAGAFATRPLFTSAARGSGFKLRASERAVSVEVLAAPDGATLAAGMRVDLLASGYSGANTTELLLAGAEVLAASENRITIRVSAAQAPSIVRGDVFAKELRAVVRP